METRFILNSVLLKFLNQEGYKNLQLRGIELKTELEQTQGNKEDYILLPLKSDLKMFEESDLRIEAIDSSEITDMMDVEFGITFWIELSNDLAKKYISGTNSK